MELSRVDRAGAGARFVNIGERCNVTGSARFKKLILAGDYEAAVEVARDQVEKADTAERKVSICERQYKLLTADGTEPNDIIFDPNIFAVATGIEEHRRYALDFVEAAREIRARCPGTHISRGLSNLSFSFRG